MLRGLAAILVAIGHIRLMFILNAKEVLGLKWYVKPFYFITNLGSSSVMIFFVLSGFFIGSTVLQKTQNNTWAWGRYIAARASRIYTVLVPALVLGMAFDLTGLHVLGTSIVYSTPHYGWMLPENIADNISPIIALGNLLSLQEIFVPTLGSNHPLWSLTNEVWYYALFPLLILGLTKHISMRKRVIYIVFFIGIFYILTPPIRSLFLVWLMGAALTFIPKMKVRYWQTLAAALLLVGWLAAESLKIIDANDYITGLLTSLLIYSVICQAEYAVPKAYEWLATQISAISYTLYLTHTPFVVFLAALIIRQGPKMQPDAKGIGTAIIIFLLACLYAVLVWFLFESRTKSVKYFLEKLFSSKSNLSETA